MVPVAGKNFVPYKINVKISDFWIFLHRLIKIRIAGFFKLWFLFIHIEPKSMIVANVIKIDSIAEALKMTNHKILYKFVFMFFNCYQIVGGLLAYF